MALITKKDVAPAFWIVSSSYLFVYSIIDFINSKFTNFFYDGLTMIIAGIICILAYISIGGKKDEEIPAYY